MQTGAQTLTIRRNKQIITCQVASRRLVLFLAVTLFSVHCGLARHVILLLSYQLYWLYFYLQCTNVAHS